MSSNHEVSSRGERSTQIPPEVPRRPRSTLQGARSAQIGHTPHARINDGVATATPRHPQPPQAPPGPHPHPHGVGGHPAHTHTHSPQPAVREIHKNAWLKRILPTGSSDKKGGGGGGFIKKYDKHWVVFCVHDDVEPFLEFYPEPKAALSHRPPTSISLTRTLHVSPSILGQENDEYSFAVTLHNQVLRLVAANWDQMIEWVESLQGKLREMSILSPKDNLYSKLPEAGPGVIGAGAGTAGTPGIRGACLPSYISTRDPNSPLPPPPTRLHLHNGINGHHNNNNSSLPAPAPAPLPPPGSGGGGGGNGLSLSLDLPHPLQNGFDYEADNVTTTTTTDGLGQLVSIPNGHGHGHPSSRGVGPAGAPTPSTNMALISTPLPPVSLLNENYGLPGVTMCAYVQPPSSAGSDSGLGGSGGSMLSSISEPSSSSSRVTIFPISVGSRSQPAGSHSHSHDNEGFEPEVLEECSPSGSSGSASVVSVVTGNNNSTRVQVGSDEHEAVTMTTPTPLYSQAKKQSKATPTPHTPAPTATPAPPPTVATVTPRVRNHNNDRDRDPIGRQLSDPPRPNSTPSSQNNVYEYLFPLEGHQGQGQRISNANANANNNSNSEGGGTGGPPLVPRRNAQRKLPNSNSTRTHHRSSSLNRLEDTTTNGVNPRAPRGRGREDDGMGDGRTNENHNHKGTGTTFIHIHGLQGEPIDALITVQSGEYRIRRDEGQGQGQCQGQAIPASMSHIPLKEQQVMRLRSEMEHPGGVRVVLRKKDCVGSIGFVDYLGAVWIAGWKQSQHPVLYYAFHVGDQILSVGGIAVQNSLEAMRAIKMASCPQIEFMLRRLPHGAVFVLKRSREGEPLGLVAINNTAELGEVLPEGLAASQGLPPSCRGADGAAAATWFLTEVNNRPLSLLARENEVRERLSAVGKEISILVQPSDLVKQLRKALKAMKGFKDYLVG